MAKKNTEKSERKESLMRILIFIITGVIVYLWGYVSLFLILVNWILTLISGKRNQAIGEFVEKWSSTVYYFAHYVSGESNERPFPFTRIKSVGKFE